MGLLLVSLWVGCAVGGCRSTETADGSITHPGDEAANAEVDRLRSLGYLGLAEGKRARKGDGVLRRKAGFQPGYSLYANPYLCSAVLIDEAGGVKNFWSDDRSCERWANVELLADGDLLVVGRSAGPGQTVAETDARRFLERLGWKGELRWRRTIPVHHDVEQLPSGKLLTLTTGLRRVPAIHSKIPVSDNRIAILSPDGAELESASLYDLFAAAPEVVTIQKVKPRERAEIDLFHANSVEWIRPGARVGSHPIYAVRNVLVCSRHQDVIFVVDWKRKKLLWAWGRGELSGPHDATLLENGNILIFDNGLARGWSRVIELDPVTGKIVWQYSARNQKAFFTLARGSDQRLANGNTLLAESDSGRAFEVTPQGKIVWEFRNPLRTSDGKRVTIARIERFAPGFIDGVVARFGEGTRAIPADHTLARTAPTRDVF